MQENIISISFCFVWVENVVNKIIKLYTSILDIWGFLDRKNDRLQCKYMKNIGALKFLRHFFFKCPNIFVKHFVFLIYIFYI